MGLFGLFRKKTAVTAEMPEPHQEPAENRTIPAEEKKYYQPDSYYSEKAFEDTPFEKTVITFEERKKTAVPSARGLYPAQILLLEYCSKGTYPGPQNGYPGFWWFEYGIRDVGSALKNLEKEGFIVLAPAADSLKCLTIPQLKELLETHGQSGSGKKADLIERVKETVSEESLTDAGVQPKYILTELGKAELEENAYVPYMHNIPSKTTEDPRSELSFNIWSINKLLGSEDKSNWKTIVDDQEQKINTLTDKKNKAFMNELKKADPQGYKVLKTQDQQIAACQKAQAKYEQDKDIDYYIGFWEHLWANGGLKFEGSGWHFKLPDLYIKEKRYDDALNFCKKLRSEKPAYRDKADQYINRIESLKEKQTAKKK